MVVSIVISTGSPHDTRCFNFDHLHIPVSELRNAVASGLHVPSEEVKLLHCCKYMRDGVFVDDYVSPQTNPVFMEAHYLGLKGGKGGFGSLLRGQATRVGQKKTTNQTACRDLSGRRLRHVQNEKKLTDWMSQQDERRKQELEVRQQKAEKERQLERKLNEEELEKVRLFDDKIQEALQKEKQQSTTKRKREHKHEEQTQTQKKKKKKNKLFTTEFDEEDDNDSQTKIATASASEIPSGDQKEEHTAVEPQQQQH